jgi:hypothetical protein
MPSQKANQFKFVRMLLEKELCEDKIVQFLIDEFIITVDESMAIKTAYLPIDDKVSIICKWLTKDTLQLVSYEWQILPKEFYQLTIVAPHNSLEIVSSR